MLLSLTLMQIISPLEALQDLLWLPPFTSLLTFCVPSLCSTTSGYGPFCPPFKRQTLNELDDHLWGRAPLHWWCHHQEGWLLDPANMEGAWTWGLLCSDVRSAMRQAVAVALVDL